MNTIPSVLVENVQSVAFFGPHQLLELASSMFIWFWLAQKVVSKGTEDSVHADGLAGSVYLPVKGLSCEYSDDDADALVVTDGKAVEAV
jgi:hypothetical protein